MKDLPLKMQTKITQLLKTWTHDLASNIYVLRTFIDNDCTSELKEAAQCSLQKINSIQKGMVDAQSLLSQITIDDQTHPTEEPHFESLLESLTQKGHLKISGPEWQRPLKNQSLLFSFLQLLMKMNINAINRANDGISVSVNRKNWHSIEQDQDNPHYYKLKTLMYLLSYGNFAVTITENEKEHYWINVINSNPRSSQ